MKGINHIIIKLFKTSNKEKKPKTNQKKRQVTYEKLREQRFFTLRLGRFGRKEARRQ